MAKASNSTPPAGVMTGPDLRVERVNRFVFDDKRFWHCAVTKIERQPPLDPTKGPRAKWTLTGPGTVRSWELHFTTPLELGEAMDDDDMEEIIDEQEAGEAAETALLTNPLAQICLKLHLLTDDQLKPAQLEQTLQTFNLRAAVGLSVQCQIAKRNRAFIDGEMKPCRAYYTPKLETLALD